MNSRRVLPTNICPQVFQFARKLENTVMKISPISQVIIIFFLPSHPFLIACSFVAEIIVCKVQNCYGGRVSLTAQVTECHCGDWVPLLPPPLYSNGIISRFFQSEFSQIFLQIFSVYGHAKSSCVKYKLIGAVF